jgi:hypothetical protein
LCITAKLIVEWQRWVKPGKAQNEQMISGLPLIADILSYVARFVLGDARRPGAATNRTETTGPRLRGA